MPRGMSVDVTGFNGRRASLSAPADGGGGNLARTWQTGASSGLSETGGSAFTATAPAQPAPLSQSLGGSGRHAHPRLAAKKSAETSAMLHAAVLAARAAQDFAEAEEEKGARSVLRVNAGEATALAAGSTSAFRKSRGARRLRKATMQLRHAKALRKLKGTMKEHQLQRKRSKERMIDRRAAATGMVRVQGRRGSNASVARSTASGASGASPEKDMQLDAHFYPVSSEHFSTRALRDDSDDDPFSHLTSEQRGRIRADMVRQDLMSDIDSKFPGLSDSVKWREPLELKLGPRPASSREPLSARARLGTAADGSRSPRPPTSPRRPLTAREWSTTLERPRVASRRLSTRAGPEDHETERARTAGANTRTGAADHHQFGNSRPNTGRPKSPRSALQANTAKWIASKSGPDERGDIRMLARANYYALGKVLRTPDHRFLDFQESAESNGFVPDISPLTTTHDRARTAPTPRRQTSPRTMQSVAETEPMSNQDVDEPVRDVPVIRTDDYEMISLEPWPEATAFDVLTDRAGFENTEDAPAIDKPASPQPAQTVVDALEKAGDALAGSPRASIQTEEERRNLARTAAARDRLFLRAAAGDYKERTLRLSYFKRCEELGIAAEPAGFACDGEFSDAVVVDLSNYSLGDDAVTALAVGFRTLRSAVTIDLSKNRLKAHGIAAVASNLPRGLRCLNLCGNPISQHGVRALESMLPDSRLEMLLLADCQLGDRLGAQLVKAAAAATTARGLKALDLSNNRLGSATALQLRNLLLETRTLERLGLSWNSLGRYNAVKLFEGLDGNSTLRELDLSWNGVGSSRPARNEAVQKLADALRHNVVLQHLHLGNNALGVSDCKVLSEALLDNHGLLGIHLEGNDARVDAKGFVLPSEPMISTVPSDAIAVSTTAATSSDGKPARQSGNTGGKGTKSNIAPKAPKKKRKAKKGRKGKGRKQIKGLRPRSWKEEMFPQPSPMGVGRVRAPGTAIPTADDEADDDVPFAHDGDEQNRGLNLAVKLAVLAHRGDSRSTFDILRDRVASKHMSQRLLSFDPPLSHRTAHDAAMPADCDVRIHLSRCWVCEGWSEVHIQYTPELSGIDGKQVAVHFAIDHWVGDLMHEEWIPADEDDIARRTDLMEFGKEKSRRGIFGFDADKHHHTHAPAGPTALELAAIDAENAALAVRDALDIPSDSVSTQKRTSKRQHSRGSNSHSGGFGPKSGESFRFDSELGIKARVVHGSLSDDDEDHEDAYNTDSEMGDVLDSFKSDGVQSILSNKSFHVGIGGPAHDRLGSSPDFDSLFEPTAKQAGIRNNAGELKTFVLHRMLPPGRHAFIFVVDGATLHAHDHDMKPYSRKLSLWTKLPRSDGKLPAEPQPRSNMVEHVAVPRFVNVIETSAREDLTIPQGLSACPRPRSDEIPPAEPPKWSFPISIWADYDQLSGEALSEAFEVDWAYGRYTTLISDDVTRLKVKLLLREAYGELLAIFKMYCAMTSPPFVMTWNAWSSLMSHCHVQDKQVNLVALDTLFIQGYSGPRVSKRDQLKLLPRFRFLEMIVRLAKKKFCEKNSLNPTRSIFTAVKRILRDHILKHAERFDAHGWKWTHLYCEEIDLVLKADLDALVKLFGKFSGRFAKPGEAPFMSLAEFEDFLQEFHLMDDTFTDQRRLLSYIWAQELVEDDMASDQAERMSFVEFVHVLCFIANMRSAASSGVVDVEEQSRESPTSPLLKGSPRSSPSPQPSASTDWLQHAAARIEDEVERHGSDPDSWNILAGKSVVGRDLATVSTLLPGIHLYPTRSVLKSKIEDLINTLCGRVSRRQRMRRASTVMTPPALVQLEGLAAEAADASTPTTAVLPANTSADNGGDN